MATKPKTLPTAPTETTTAPGNGAGETTKPDTANSGEGAGTGDGSGDTAITEAEEPDLRFATVASPIDHDGFTYLTDDPIPLTEAAFNQLRATGALVEATWDELVTF